MMAITHELKTPIAVAKLNLETMQKYQLDAEKKEKMIRTTLDEIARLNLLTNNILISSQLEGQGNFSNREELDFSLLAKDAIKEFGKRFPDTKVVANIVEEIELIGDPLLLQILLNNLLENANKYSPKGSAIEVGLSIKNNSVILTVADYGEGIPANEKTKIFNRFYRVGNELTRKTKGTGLGLYLCSLIAKTHDGTIEVSDNSPTGTIFSVIFAL
jgi:K+-sensing histidine kinase KdpD